MIHPLTQLVSAAAWVSHLSSWPVTSVSHSVSVLMMPSDHDWIQLDYHYNWLDLVLVMLEPVAQVWQLHYCCYYCF